ncbi:MAG: hypothetical protein R8K50_01180 [Mariprofundus sp.]
MSEGKPAAEPQSDTALPVSESSASDHPEQPASGQAIKDGGGKFGRIIALLFVVIALVFGALAAAGQLQPLLHKLTASFDTDTAGEHATAQAVQPGLTQPRTDTPDSGEPAPAQIAAVTEEPLESISEAIPEPVSASAERSVEALAKQLAAKPSSEQPATQRASTAQTQTEVEAVSPAAIQTIAPVKPQRAEETLAASPGRAVADAAMQAQSDATAAANAAAQAQALADRRESRAEIKRLMQTIGTLSNELARMNKAQGELKANQQHQQQMELQVRLGWLSDPAITLPQQQQAWEEIALLPGLTQAQRQQARQMHVQISAVSRQVQQWRDTLKRWADVMVAPAVVEVLPQPEHPWLAWIVGQFHVHKAASAETQQRSALRSRLLDTSRQLATESWPENAAWQSLYTALLVQVQAIAAAQGKPVPELGLPASIDSLQQNLRQLHDTAMAWKARGQEGI